MAKIAIVLCAVIAAACGAPAPACVPDKTTFYWKVPCDSQTFANKVKVTNVTASQNGKSVDELGGMDISVPLDILATIQDDYGVIKKPLLDISIVEYKKNLLGQCKWQNMPTLGILDNIDACQVVPNCKLENDPKTLPAKVDVKKLAGILYAGVTVGNYYGLSLTFKDGTTPVMCIYSQDIVIKK
jgi:hypothetical protein